MNPDQKIREILKNNPDPVGRAHEMDKPRAMGDTSQRLPDWVKCKLCGRPPIGADWLKPVNSDPGCREFVHISEIPSGPLNPYAVERARRI